MIICVSGGVRWNQVLAKLPVLDVGSRTDWPAFKWVKVTMSFIISETITSIKIFKEDSKLLGIQKLISPSHSTEGPNRTKGEVRKDSFCPPDYLQAGNQSSPAFGLRFRLELTPSGLLFLRPSESDWLSWVPYFSVTLIVWLVSEHTDC